MKNDRIHPISRLIFGWVWTICAWFYSRNEEKRKRTNSDNPRNERIGRSHPEEKRRDIKATRKAELKRLNIKATHRKAELMREIETYSKIIHSHRPDIRYKPDTKGTETT